MHKIYFISGPSGVGKSSTMSHLKELLPSDQYDIRDLDERGVPDGGGLAWLNAETRHWLDVAKANAARGKHTIMCGFANPELFTEVYRPGDDVPAQLIMLHASGDALRERLRGRHATPESVREIERAAGVPLDTFIEDNITFAPKLRKTFEDAGYPVIETDDKMPAEVAGEIAELIS